MISNHWYPGCPSSQLPADRPVGTTVGDHRIVLFRDQEGRAHALLDRCCHRGFPLSESTLTQGRLRCGYHGWEYDASGCCVRIPSQSEDAPIPRTYRVQRFICNERDGYVWIWIGDGEPSELIGIPEVATGQWIQVAVTLQCNYVRALEISFDTCHVYFAHLNHPLTIRARQFGFVQSRYELRTTHDGCVLFNPPTSLAQDPIPPTAYIREFHLPGLIRFAMPWRGSFSYLIFFVTPLDACSCRMDLLVTDFDGNAGGAARIKWCGEGVGDGKTIMDEDRRVLELVQPAYAREGESFEHHVRADRPLLTMRRILKAAERGEWSGTLPGLRRRQVISMASPAPRRAEAS